MAGRARGISQLVRRLVARAVWLWDARRVPVDLRHFRSFVVVAEEGHIGRAAKRLFITQPALSRQMQQLEREIAAPIFVAALAKNTVCPL